MSTPLPIWRRLWVGLPLAYKLVLLGLGTVMTVTAAVMLVTFFSAGESLKLQMERQLSRDLNVIEAWYRTRLEEIQLTAVGLARQREVAQAAARGDLGPAAALLASEERRLALDLAVVVDRGGRLLGAAAPGPRFDPHGLATRAIAGGEQLVVTAALAEADQAALSAADRRAGLVRLVVTPIGPLGPAGRATGALILGERVDADTAIPRQITALIGGAVAVLDHRAVVAQAGFPAGTALALAPAVWADVREGRYFFAEQRLAGREYLIAFRPILDLAGRPVGAIARAFPEDEIAETLLRYAGGIALLASAAVIFALVAFFLLTRRLLFPLRRLAMISAGLAEGDERAARAAGQDEIAHLARGVVRLADRLTQSREELAALAVKLEAEALELAERNAQLARLDAEKARLLEQIRDHDRLRGQLLERVIGAQEDERKRLARELHDQTGQSLTSLLVGLKYVEGSRSLDDLKGRTADLKALTVQLIEEVHQLSLALRPAMLDDLGLVVALRSLVTDFGRQHDVKATFQADPLDRRLPPQHEVTLYRVAQEALTNVGKYAGAAAVEVTLRHDGDRLALRIADDGRGFDPTAVGADGREHLGLLGMQERVALLGGRFHLDAAPGRGTVVTVEADLPTEDPAPPDAHDTEVPHA